MQAQITIVIPVHNRQAALPATLASVAAQTLRPLAVVLVDNASTDASMKVLQEWKTAHQAPDFAIEIISCPTPGAPAARNAGLNQVRTPWTMFFDSDDLMTPDHCARALKYCSEADIVGWDINLQQPDGSLCRKRFITSDPMFSNLMHSSFGTQRYMARTEIFRRAGRWLPGTEIFDDVELGMRILALNPRIRHAGHEITVTVSHSEDSIMTRQSGQIARTRVALDAIARTLGPKHAHWADLRLLLFATKDAPGDPDAEATAHEVLARQPRARRLLWKILRWYGKKGGRGLARIYRLVGL